jgi:cytoskeleton protein RodZ
MSDTTPGESVGTQHEDTASINEGNEATGKSRPRVSVRLEEARIAQGVSREDIADRLFLGVSYIEYIDKGEFEAIKKPAFLKGYLRSYARELGLSGDEIVELYEAEVQESVDELSGLRDAMEQKAGSSSFTGPIATTGVFGLIGIVLILIAIWWFSPETDPIVITSAPGQETAAGNTRDDLGDAGLDEYTPVPVLDEQPGKVEPDIEMAASPSTSSLQDQLSKRALSGDDIGFTSNDLDQAGVSSTEAAEPGPDIADSGDAAPTVSDSMGNMTEEPTATFRDQFEVPVVRSSGTDPQMISVQAGGDDHLRIVFTDDCWLEIEDGFGNLVYGDLNHDQEILDLFGVAPFKLLVGKVSAVTVTYNGQALKLEGNRFNDTAKLTIE